MLAEELRHQYPATMLGASGNAIAPGLELCWNCRGARRLRSAS